LTKEEKKNGRDVSGERRVLEEGRKNRVRKG
jgi:hypothetical protein